MSKDTGADFAAAICLILMTIIVAISVSSAMDRQAAIDAANTKAFVDQMDQETRRIVGGGK